MDKKCLESMKVIFATSNQGKIDQVKEIFKLNNVILNIKSEKEVKFYEDVVEDGKTFEENSKIKALSLKKFCDKNEIEYDMILADDSGICVDTLNGEPGVYSARYAGENKTSQEKLDYILRKMENYKTPDERKAHFVSVITAIFKDGKIIQTRGECNGHLANHYNVITRLTYNPIFIPEGFNKPIGEMSEEEFKNVHNHREIALRKLFDLLYKI